MVRMGCYMNKEGKYKYAVITKDKVMDKHKGAKYCVICEVDTFRIKPDEVTKKTFETENDKFYDKEDVEFTGVKLIAKVRDGEWKHYD